MFHVEHNEEFLERIARMEFLGDDPDNATAYVEAYLALLNDGYPDELIRQASREFRSKQWQAENDGYDL